MAQKTPPKIKESETSVPSTPLAAEKRPQKRKQPDLALDTSKETRTEPGGDLKVDYNLYLVGNTGVGKSHLLNCYVGKEIFQSDEQETSVTRQVEQIKVSIDEGIVNVVNIPGLLEDDQERVKENMEMLKQAFDSKTKSVVCYVLTVEAGRLRSNDCDAYKALSKAYTMSDKSFCFIVNKFRGKIGPSKIADRIQHVLEKRKVFFIHEMKGNFKEDGLEIGKLMKFITSTQKAGEIKKNQDLDLSEEAVRAYKAQIRLLQVQYESAIQSQKEEYEGRLKKHMEEYNKFNATLKAVTPVLANFASTLISFGIQRVGVPAAF